MGIARFVVTGNEYFIFSQISWNLDGLKLYDYPKAIINKSPKRRIILNINDDWIKLTLMTISLQESNANKFVFHICLRVLWKIDAPDIISPSLSLFLLLSLSLKCRFYRVYKSSTVEGLRPIDKTCILFTSNDCIWISLFFFISVKKQWQFYFLLLLLNKHLLMVPVQIII